MLTISDATGSDSGNYQCIATNVYSFASDVKQILVEGRSYNIAVVLFSRDEVQKILFSY